MASEIWRHPITSIKLLITWPTLLMHDLAALGRDQPLACNPRLLSHLHSGACGGPAALPECQTGEPDRRARECNT